jgi:hypothetical protein
MQMCCDFNISRHKALASGVFLSLFIVGMGTPLKAGATANSCYQLAWTPIAWTADGEKLIAYQQGSDYEGAVAIEVWKTGKDIIACHSLEADENPREPQKCSDFSGGVENEKHTIQDTGLLKHYPVKAQPLQARKTRVELKVIKYARRVDGFDECPEDNPCEAMLGYGSECECEHMSVSIGQKGAYKKIWQGSRDTASDCGAGDGSESDLPSRSIQVWPSPNGQKALVTYWVYQPYNYYQRLEWVDLKASSKPELKDTAKPKPAVTAQDATHEVFRTAGAKEPWLNLRSRPSGKASIEARMPDGTQVVRLSNKAFGRRGWAYKVKVVSGPRTGTIGFASKSYLKPLKK